MDMSKISLNTAVTSGRNLERMLRDSGASFERLVCVFFNLGVCFATLVCDSRNLLVFRGIDLYFGKLACVLNIDVRLTLGANV